VTPPLPQSQVSLWNKVQKKMLPTPAKFHYLFNMRELSRVFQGVILCVRDRFNTKGEKPGFGGDVESPLGYLVSLWRHECERVFCDKLTTEADKLWTVDVLMALVKEEFGDELLKQVTTPVVFIDFLREPQVDDDTGEVLEANPSNYEAVESVSVLRGVVEERQRMFNESSKALKLTYVNPTRVYVNPTPVYVNLYPACVNPTRVYVNPTQVCVNPTRVYVTPTQAGAVRGRAAAHDAHRPRAVHGPRLGAAGGRGRLRQAVAHAAGGVHRRRLHLPDHHHQDVQPDQPVRRHQGGWGTEPRGRSQQGWFDTTTGPPC
jgi:hypothetical protein